jgi:hypothetical protein
MNAAACTHRRKLGAESAHSAANGGHSGHSARAGPRSRGTAGRQWGSRALSLSPSHRPLAACRVKRWQQIGRAAPGAAERSSSSWALVLVQPRRAQVHAAAGHTGSSDAAPGCTAPRHRQKTRLRFCRASGPRRLEAEAASGTAPVFMRIRQAPLFWPLRLLCCHRLSRTDAASRAVSHRRRWRALALPRGKRRLRSRAEAFARRSGSQPTSTPRSSL